MNTKLATLRIWRTVLKICSIWILSIATASAANVIEISALDGANNQNLITALKQAARYDGKPVVIKMNPGIYRLFRSEAITLPYYISNTTSESEDPDPTKHIGMLLHSLKNVTIDGCGSTLLMNGEMTGFILDHCQNIVIKNLNIDHQAPTQVEIEILKNGKDYLIAKVHPTSHYRIENGILEWQGEGWKFTQGIAQMYDRWKDITWRSWSPTENLIHTVELRPGTLYMQYKEKPEIKENSIFQIRDAIRDEVCGLVNRCKNVRIENVNFYYLGNFGVVCQYSENITVERSNFAPEPGSGRTNAGFADFLQVSGCKGMIDIKNSRFVGAHDDPINIHGTHLKVTDFLSADRIKVRFMHPQTFGFEAFFKGDEIELTDAHSLLPVKKTRVKKARLVTPREMELTLEHQLPEELLSRQDLVVENITWTPEVRITNNYFARIPTRGVLISTRRKALIEGNTFYGMQMSGILVADDALSWYESGPVHDLTIRRNTFLQCGTPVILIEPENRVYKGAVHKNIVIEENRFEMKDNNSIAVKAKAVDGLVLRNNFIHFPEGKEEKKEQSIQTNDCEHVTIENNQIM